MTLGAIPLRVIISLPINLFWLCEEYLLLIFLVENLKKNQLTGIQIKLLSFCFLYIYIISGLLI